MFLWALNTCEVLWLVNIYERLDGATWCCSHHDPALCCDCIKSHHSPKHDLGELFWELVDKWLFQWNFFFIYVPWLHLLYEWLWKEVVVFVVFNVVANFMFRKEHFIAPIIEKLISNSRQFPEMRNQKPKIRDTWHYCHWAGAGVCGVGMWLQLMIHISV